MKISSLLNISLLSLLLFAPRVNADPASDHSSATADYRANLVTHLNNHILKKVQEHKTVPVKKEEIPTSNVWSSYGYGKTKDTSSEGLGSSRSNALSIGGDSLYGDWTLGITLAGVHSNSKTFLTPPGETVSNAAVLQPYVSYQVREWMSFFGSGGVTYSDGKAINQSTPSNGHELTLSYIGTVGTVFILPIIKEHLLPTFRISTTRVQSKTNSYIWSNTYNPKVNSHQQTLDPAFRFSFLTLDNFVPYIEYGTHWIINRSHNISTEHRKMGQTFSAGGTIFLENHYQLGFFYARDNLTTPGYRDYVSLRVSKSF